MSNKDTIIEALTMQLKLEREGNLALAKLSKREWVGLHEHELQVLEYNDPSGERLKLAKAVEAKLKEKNT